MREFAPCFLKKIGMPEEHIPWLLSHIQALDASESFHQLLARFMAQAYTNRKDVLEEAAAIGREIGLHPYTAHLVFYICASKPLLAMYRQKGVEEEIYWNSMEDLTCKLKECLLLEGIVGTKSGEWHASFYHMQKFALGRMQYVQDPFGGELYEKHGITIRPGDMVPYCHIPSGGALTWEKRLDSYKRVHRFYGKEYGKVVPIVCSSWLLYPAHRQFLPKNSNILSFMDDFDIVNAQDEEHFSNAWRIYGAAGGKSPEHWPTDTGLQRAYAQWIRSGGKTGRGLGILLFDGEKILR